MQKNQVWFPFLCFAVLHYCSIMTINDTWHRHNPSKMCSAGGQVTLRKRRKMMWSSLTCSSFINLGTGSFLEELQRDATKLWSHWGQRSIHLVNNTQNIVKLCSFSKYGEANWTIVTRRLIISTVAPFEKYWRFLTTTEKSSSKNNRFKSEPTWNGTSWLVQGPWSGHSHTDSNVAPLPS